MSANPPNCCEGHYYAGMGRCGEFRPAEVLDVVADPPATPAPLVGVEAVQAWLDADCDETCRHDPSVIEAAPSPCRWCGDIPERRQATGDPEHGQVDEGPSRAESLPPMPAQGSDAL